MHCSCVLRVSEHLSVESDGKPSGETYTTEESGISTKFLHSQLFLALPFLRKLPHRILDLAPLRRFTRFDNMIYPVRAAKRLLKLPIEPSESSGRRVLILDVAAVVPDARVPQGVVGGVAREAQKRPWRSCPVCE